MQRRLVVEVGVLLALCIHRSRVGGELASSGGRHVDHGDHRVHRAGVANFGPVEGLHQRLGQGQATGFNQDVVDLVAPRNQRLHDGVKLFLHGAAQAAIGQLIQLALAFGLAFFTAQAAVAQQLAVDAQLAKLVDDDGDAAAIGVGQDVAHQGGFATAQKTGDDGGGDFLTAVHAVSAPCSETHATPVACMAQWRVNPASRPKGRQLTVRADARPEAHGRRTLIRNTGEGRLRQTCLNRTVERATGQKRRQPSPAPRGVLLRCTSRSSGSSSSGDGGLPKSFGLPKGSVA